jgi:hypothetical protein
MDTSSDLSREERLALLKIAGAGTASPSAELRP